MKNLGCFFCHAIVIVLNNSGVPIIQKPHVSILDESLMTMDNVKVMKKPEYVCAKCAKNLYPLSIDQSKL